MALVVRGRVVDEWGQPVAGACVHLKRWSAPIVLRRSGTNARSEVLATTDAEGYYSFEVTEHSAVLAVLQEGPVSVCAYHQQRVSEKLVIDWIGESAAPDDLVLVEGVFGRVQAHWSDGSPAKGVVLQAILEASMPETGDERSSVRPFHGKTDDAGVLSFGPVPDDDYSVVVRALPPEAPAQTFAWNSIHLQAPLELSLRPGREVRGTLLTAEGQPAVGYRVGPGQGGSGELGSVVTTSGDGSFAVRGVDHDDGAIMVYEGLLRDALEPRRTGPLLIERVPPGVMDVGTITLPVLGSLVIRLADASGGPVQSGTAAWERKEIRHAHAPVAADAEGCVRFDRIPLGIAVHLRVSFRDDEYGALRQVFSIDDVREETVTFCLTGSGTIIVRLHPASAPMEPLHVCRGVLTCDGTRVAQDDGPTPELRGWTDAQHCAVLRVSAVGFRDHVAKDVDLCSSGPTVIDVEL